MRSFHVFLAAGLFVLALCSPAQGTVTIETVPVGDTGNTNDTHGDGYGAVSGAYNIGKYEVTAGQYTGFLNAVAKTDAYGLYNASMVSSSYGCKIERTGPSGSYVYSIDANRVNRPVNYVSWGDAARFANWLHNGQPTGPQSVSTTEDGAYSLNGATSDAALLAVSREADWQWAIPTEHEWYKAAYYDPTLNGGAGGYHDFPTGTDTYPSNDLANPDPGNNANFNSSGYTIGSPYYTTEAGDFENSASPYGTFDQGGNVGEWNESVVNTSYRGNRGGSFIIGPSFMRANSSSYGNPSFQTYTIGFRVAQVPEPATLSLLAVGAVALLRRRRR